MQAPTMEASSGPARQRKVNWRLRWGLKVGKITYRLLTSLPGLKFWSSPATTCAEPRHKAIPSMDSGICIPFGDHEEASEGLSGSRAPPTAAVVVTPRLAISTPPVVIPARPSPPPPEPDVDPLFSMDLTLRSRQHIDEAIANGAFTFPYPNLAKDNEEIQSFSRQLQQSTPVPHHAESASTSPRVQQATITQASLLIPWDTFDQDLTRRRSIIAHLADTHAALTAEAASLDAILDSSTQGTRMGLQRAKGKQHIKTPIFARDVKRFQVAHKRLDRLHTKISETLAQWSAAVGALEQLKQAQYFSD
ncbi:hypothetical protein B0T18DRAFT_387224 [Schizothecium vesticola]|uniref:Uncharacterized protein n=1 Tax=Schizothecium vesticola TaxID=314040 RepID=A0AA40F4U7_9PEZI|nr:hypothetical protein B0T18DRAFT_387224 [Schizothecium vesticola]